MNNVDVSNFFDLQQILVVSSSAVVTIGPFILNALFDN